MTVKPLSVVYFIPALSHGGAQKQLVYLAALLKARGWDPHIIVAWAELATSHAVRLQEAGIRIHSLGIRERSPDVHILPRLLGTLQHIQPSILHSYLFHANMVARVVRLLYRVPIQVSSVRNIIEGRRWRETAYRLTDPLCDITVQNSQEGADRYVEIKAVPAHKMRVIMNGIDTKLFTPDPEVRDKKRKELDVEKRFLWLTVGRLERSKNYGTLLQAYAQVVMTYPQSLLLVSGDGSLRHDLETQAQAWGLNAHVQFLGSRDDIPELMNAADAFVLSSSWEGTPNVLLEAAATACVSVATDVGACRTVIQDGETGFLAQSDNPALLAEKMRTVMSLEENTRLRIGEAARAYVETHFSFERSLDHWEQLYRGLLAEKGIRV